MPSVNPFRVTRFVTFRRGSTQGSPCSSVWQNGDAALAIRSELDADRAGALFVADGRLEAVDAARGGIGRDDMLLEPLQLRGVLGRQGPPLSGRAGFAAERAELDAKAALGSRAATAGALAAPGAANTAFGAAAACSCGESSRSPQVWLPRPRRGAAPRPRPAGARPSVWPPVAKPSVLPAALLQQAGRATRVA